MNQFSRTVHKEATPRCGHIAVSYDKYMIVWGGYSSERSFEYYLPANELWVYSTENRLWHCVRSESNDCPIEVSGASACCHGDYLYVFGGHGKPGNSNELNRLDLKTFTWQLMESQDTYPSPRDKAVAWFYQKKFYVFSGFGPSLDGYLNENGTYIEDTDSSIWPRRGWNNQLLIYDTEEAEWTNPVCKGEVPLPRAASAVAPVNNVVYLFGGRHKTKRMNDLHCIDLATCTWSGELETSGCLPCGRSWHSFTAINHQRLFLYGGFDSNNVPLSDGWILNIPTLSWFQLEHLSSDCPRLWHTANLTCEGEMIIFGGCHNNILDYSINNKISGEILLIQMQPYSLLRLCLDEVYNRKSATQASWKELPQSLCNQLQERNHLELLCKSYDIDSDSDSDNNVHDNEPGLACTVS